MELDLVSLRVPPSSNERGQGMVEFALIIPILLFIVVGIFDLGRGIYYYNVVSGSAREAARKSIVCGGATTATDCSTVDSTTKNTVVGQAIGVPMTSSNITISPSSRKYGDTLIVTINITFVPLTTLVVGGANVPIRARSSMIVE